MMKYEEIDVHVNIVNRWLIFFKGQAARPKIWERHRSLFSDAAPRETRETRETKEAKEAPPVVRKGNFATSKLLTYIKTYIKTS